MQSSRLPKLFFVLIRLYFQTFQSVESESESDLFARKVGTNNEFIMVEGAYNKHIILNLNMWSNYKGT